MKFVRFQDKAGNIQTGTLEGETIHIISGDFLTSYEQTGKTTALGEVKLLAPVMPSKMVAVGRNYFDHAKELGNEVPKKPGHMILFTHVVLPPFIYVIYDNGLAKLRN